MRFGLIGFGAIGATVARAAAAGQTGRARLAAVLVRTPGKVSGVECPVTASLERFLETPFEVAVEAAGHEALRAYGEAVLRSGRDLVTVSAGALADEGFAQRLYAAAEAGGRHLIVPSGAMGALDYLSSAAVGRLDRVTLTTRKPPEAWRGTVGEGRLGETANGQAVCLYEGPAREAARLYPQNVNVAAALGLAGIGLDRTQVRIFADPTVRLNTHELAAEGEFGRFSARLEGEPSAENPKTGRIAVMSVIKALQRLSSPVWIGM